MWPTYVIPRLVYGLEVEKLSRTDIDGLEGFQRKCLCQIPGLPDKTPNCVTLSVMGVPTVYNYFIPFCATVKTITHKVLWMTRCTVARGRRPRATVHRVIHSTEGVIVLTVAQKGMK